MKCLTVVFELLQVVTILFLSTGQSIGFGGHQGQAPGGYQFGQCHAGVQHQGQAIAGNQWPYILILFYGWIAEFSSQFHFPS